MLRTSTAVLSSLFLIMVAGTEAFEAKIHTKDGKTLPYQWLPPKSINKSKRYPLVVFLHGAGERGNDNQAQMRHCVRDFAKKQDQFPCYVIAPQCPKGKRWVEVNWGDPNPHTMPKEPSYGMGLLLDLLPKLIKENRIDKNRIYVVGLSMGGFGTWDLLMRQPKRFAAAIPICGGADNSRAKTIAHIPVWVWHGDKDTVVKTVRSQGIVAALREAGGKPKYTELPGVGHGSWGIAFRNKELLPWLFSQKKPKR